MKIFFSLISLIFISYSSYSQTKGISFQAVIIDPNPIEIPGKDIAAQPYVSKDVWIRFGIYSGTTLQYEELHKTKTDEYGLASLVIGAGDNTGRTGTFSSLSWDGITKNIITNVSFDQGVRYTEVSNQRLTYVPYTFLAETAVKLAGVLPIASGGTGAANTIAARTNLGLGNVDNTSDLNKPISTAAQTALNGKALIASPTFTGTVTAPTLVSGTVTLPNTNGTNGQVLTTNGSGTASWTTLSVGSGDLVSTNNLSDVSNAATARTNLGLGTASNNNASDFEVPLTISTPLVRTANTITIPAATATVNGYLAI